MCLTTTGRQEDACTKDRDDTRGARGGLPALARAELRRFRLTLAARTN